jgi:hypothetical protein
MTFVALVQDDLLALRLQKRATHLSNLPPEARKLTGQRLSFEAGLSESLAKSRCDANWWLVNSGGEVMIVIIIVKPADKSLRIEKWENVAPAIGRPNTGANPSTPIPTPIQQITITKYFYAYLYHHKPTLHLPQMS